MIKYLKKPKMKIYTFPMFIATSVMVVMQYKLGLF